MRADHCAHGDERALRERGEPGDADGECEADRRAREVEPVGEVGCAGFPEHERCKRRDRERGDRDRAAWAPRRAELAIDVPEFAHSTASVIDRARQAKSRRPSASGITSR
jgi:hypothetical protein